jgi:sulfonate transport system permease protein
MAESAPETPAASPPQGEAQPAWAGPARAAVFANSLRPWWFPLALLALFELYTRSVAQGSDSLAPPTAALRAFAGAAMDGSLLQATAFTLGAAALGLVIGATLGVALGIALGLSRHAAQMGVLSIELLRPVPSVALIPLAMLVFGFGLRMELSVVAFASFWPMLILTQAAVAQVEPRLLEVSQVLGLSPWQRGLKIVLPAIVPRLFVALRLGVAVALVVAVTVEIAANPNGMGYAMMIAQQSLDPALMLAWLGWIGVVGYAINAAALRLQRAVARRMGAAG